MINSNNKVILRFAGTKYNILDIIDKPIVITDYQKESSTRHIGNFYYKIQFIMKDVSGAKKLGFLTCGSSQITEVLDSNPKLPLYKTFVQVGRGLYFKENISTDEEVIEALVEKLNIEI